MKMAKAKKRTRQCLLRGLEDCWGAQMVEVSAGMSVDNKPNIAQFCWSTAQTKAKAWTKGSCGLIKISQHAIRCQSQFKSFLEFQYPAAQNGSACGKAQTVIHSIALLHPQSGDPRSFALVQILKSVDRGTVQSGLPLHGSEELNISCTLYWKRKLCQWY